MHPEMARTLAAQHQDELTTRSARVREQAESSHAARSRGMRHRVPRWQVNWSRTTLAPAGASGRRERSWVIIISATTRDA